MKRFLLFLFFLCFSISFAQSYSEKYNSLLGRYEYYNTQGTLVGYKTYDDLNRQWNYTDVSQTTQTYTPTSSINLPLIKQVMATKQKQYDSNLASINSYVDQLRTLLNNSTFNEVSKSNIKKNFNTLYLNPMHAKGYDYSDTPFTNQLLQWLKNGFDSVVSYEIESLKREQGAKTTITNQVMNEIAYHSGTYKTTNVTDEKYNPYTKQYEVEKVDNTVSRIHIDAINSQIHYLRSENDSWRYYTWRFDNSTDDFYELIDEKNKCVMQLSKDFDGIIFYEEKVGDVYTKRYLYRNLKKDTQSTYKP